MDTNVHAWILVLTSAFIGLSSSLRLKGTGYMSNDPDPRCGTIGQLLVDREDPCSYLVCDYGNIPEKDSSGKHKLFVRKMPCAPGTSVPRDYERTSKLVGNPCTSKEYSCKISKPMRRSRPRFSMPHGKKFKDERKHPNAVIKMTVMSKENVTNSELVFGMMKNVWHQITNRIQQLEHRRSLRQYPRTLPDFKDRMTDLQSLWNEMIVGVETLLKNKARGRNKNPAEVTRRMRELQALWLKMWRKISELHTLEIVSVQPEPINEPAVHGSQSMEVKPQSSSSTKKMELPKHYFEEAPVYSNKQITASLYRPKPQTFSQKDKRPVYGDKSNEYQPNYVPRYGKDSHEERYIITPSGGQATKDADSTYQQPFGHGYAAKQEVYPPLSQEYLPPSKRGRREHEDIGYQMPDRQQTRGLGYGGASQYQTTKDEQRGDGGYGNERKYDTYTDDQYDKPSTDSSPAQDNSAPNYRPYEEQGYQPSYQSKPQYLYENNNVESNHDPVSYGKNKREEKRPPPPLETFDENSNMDIMVPSGFGSEMPLKSLWMEMKGVLGYMMENGKLEAANIPEDATEYEYDPNMGYYNNDNSDKAPPSGQKTEQHNRRSNPSPPRRYKYPEGRQLFGSPQQAGEYQGNADNQADLNHKSEPLPPMHDYKKDKAESTYNDQTTGDQNGMTGQAPIVAELGEPAKVTEHPDMNLEAFDIDKFDRAYKNSISQWRKLENQQK